MAELKESQAPFLPTLEEVLATIKDVTGKKIDNALVKLIKYRLNGKRHECLSLGKSVVAIESNDTPFYPQSIPITTSDDWKIPFSTSSHLPPAWIPITPAYIRIVHAESGTTLCMERSSGKILSAHHATREEVDQMIESSKPRWASSTWDYTQSLSRSTEALSGMLLSGCRPPTSSLSASSLAFYNQDEVLFGREIPSYLKNAVLESRRDKLDLESLSPEELLKKLGHKYPTTPYPILEDKQVMSLEELIKCARDHSPVKSKSRNQNMGKTKKNKAIKQSPRLMVRKHKQNLKISKSDSYLARERSKSPSTPNARIKLNFDYSNDLDQNSISSPISQDNPQKKQTNATKDAQQSLEEDKILDRGISSAPANLMQLESTAHGSKIERGKPHSKPHSNSPIKRPESTQTDKSARFPAKRSPSPLNTQVRVEKSGNKDNNGNPSDKKVRQTTVLDKNNANALPRTKNAHQYKNVRENGESLKKPNDHKQLAQEKKKDAYIGPSKNIQKSDSSKHNSQRSNERASQSPKLGKENDFRNQKNSKMTNSGTNKKKLRPLDKNENTTKGKQSKTKQSQIGNASTFNSSQSDIVPKAGLDGSLSQEKIKDDTLVDENVITELLRNQDEKDLSLFAKTIQNEALDVLEETMEIEESTKIEIAQNAMNSKWEEKLESSCSLGVVGAWEGFQEPNTKEIFYRNIKTGEFSESNPMASKPITRSFSKSTLDSNAASTRPDSRQSTQSRRSSRFAQGQNDRRTSNMLSSELLTYLPETKVHDESNRNNGPETSKQNEIAASNDLLDSVENNQDTVSEKMEPWEWMQRKRRSSLIGIADTHGIWEEWQEYETKKVYYRNKLTGECQWSVPNSGIQAKTSQKSEKKKRKKEKKKRREAKKWESRRLHSVNIREFGDWEQYLDADTGHMFYYNRITKASQWQQPVEVGTKLRLAHRQAKQNESNEQNSETNSSNTKWTQYRANSILIGNIGPSGQWQQYRHVESGRDLFYNVLTKACQWGFPEELKSSEEYQTTQALANKRDSFIDTNQWSNPIGPMDSDSDSDSDSDNDSSEGSDSNSSDNDSYGETSNRFGHKHKERQEIMNHVPFSKAEEKTPPENEQASQILERSQRVRRASKLIHTPMTTSPLEQNESEKKKKEESEWQARRRVSTVVKNAGVWQQYIDPTTKVAFYYNTVTGESTWRRPDDILPTEAHKTNTELYPSEKLHNFSSSNSEFENSGEKTATLKEWKDRRRQSVMRRSVGAWQEFFDSSSGRTFFYNARTGVSQWDHPGYQAISIEKPIEERVKETRRRSVRLGLDPSRKDVKGILATVTEEEENMASAESHALHGHYRRQEKLRSNSRMRGDSGSDADLFNTDEQLTKELTIGPSQAGSDRDWTNRRRTSRLIRSTQGGNEWEQYWDGKLGASFWHNPRTGVSTWTKPECFISDMGDKPSRQTFAKSKKESNAQDTAEDANSIRKRSVLVRASISSSAWGQYVDPVTGRVFFFNSVTQKVQWTRPEGLNEVSQEQSQTQ